VSALQEKASNSRAPLRRSLIAGAFVVALITIGVFLAGA
jgi:hypothetical protein